MTDAEYEEELRALHRRHDEELRALRQQAAEQEHHIAAQREMLRELQRRNDYLEREWAAYLAKLTPREREIAERELAEDDPAKVQ